MQAAHFLISLSTAALPRREPAFSGTSLVSCRAQGDDKIDCPLLTTFGLGTTSVALWTRSWKSANLLHLTAC